MDKRFYSLVKQIEKMKPDRWELDMQSLLQDFGLYSVK